MFFNLLFRRVAGLAVDRFAAAGGVGALAALLVVWLGNWGVAIDAVLALAIILGLFMRSRRNAPDRLRELCR